MSGIPSPGRLVTGLRLDHARRAVTRAVLADDLRRDHDDEARRFALLTAAEQAVLVLLGEGLTYRQIAGRLNRLRVLDRVFSEDVVKELARGVRERCRARNSTHLVAMAVRAGVLDAPMAEPASSRLAQ